MDRYNQFKHLAAMFRADTGCTSPLLLDTYGVLVVGSVGLHIPTTAHNDNGVRTWKE